MNEESCEKTSFSGDAFKSQSSFAVSSGSASNPLDEFKQKEFVQKFSQDQSHSDSYKSNNPHKNGLFEQAQKGSNMTSGFVQDQRHSSTTQSDSHLEEEKKANPFTA